MKTTVGIELGSYIYTPAARTVAFSGLGTDVIGLMNILAVIHVPTETILYQRGRPSLAAANYVPAVGGGTLTMNASVSTAYNANDPLYVVVDTATPEICANITNKFREAFETYDTTTRWLESKGTGDIVTLEGNSLGASYLVISKDPLSAGQVTTVETRPTFGFPLEMAVGLHRSQATLGQEFSVELVDTDTPVAAPADLTISSIQQATTTLTITTSTPHGLVPGKRIQIYGVTSDSRLNYPALVVATIPSTTQFTATAGPGGTIPSLTVGPFATGSVALRQALGGSANGTSMLFENATATNASIYARSESGDASPSGTVNANHAITVGTTASVVGLSAQSTYAFQPTNEFRLTAQVDRLQWSDVGVDSLAQSTARRTLSQVVPSILKAYKLRFRSSNNKSLTVPVAKVVSISKAGSTTWTVTTDVAHGLSTGDYINLYGNRDTTNFPNLTAATVVASIVNSTSFTVVSTTGTATGYGGTVYRVNGGNLPAALGAITQVVSTVTRTSNILSIVCSASFTGAVIGDFINIHGVREATAGADLGVDGAYRLQNINGNTVTLEPIAGVSPTGADIGLTNAGGTFIKRTDLRLSYVRVMDYERLRVEHTPRPGSDLAAAVPMVVQGGTLAVSSLPANTSFNMGQVGGQTPLILQPNGSTNRAIVAGLAGAVNFTDYSAQAWAAASGSGAVIADTNGLGLGASFDVNLTAWTAGSSSGLVVYLQESPDNGTTYYDIWQCELLTAIGRARIPAIPIGGRRRMRWVNIGGAATTATVTVTSMSLSGLPTKQVQWFDRTAGVGNGNAVINTSSAAYDIAGMKAITVVMQAGTAAAAGAFKVQMSLDGIIWYDASAAFTIPALTANNSVIPLTAGVYGRFIKVLCTSAGTTQVINAIHIYGTN